MSVGVMTVGEITVGVMTVGVMTVGVMRRPRQDNVTPGNLTIIFLFYHGLHRVQT